MSDTKIDLDELERKARAATPGPWCWIHGDFADTLKRLGDQEIVLRITDDDRSIYPHPRNCGYLACSSPDVTLALIARIRELEALATQVIRDHVRHIDESEMHALLEKGAVLR